MVTSKSESLSLLLLSKGWVCCGINVGSITIHGNKSIVLSISNWAIVIPVVSVVLVF